jgi:hypothetical protein
VRTPLLYPFIHFAIVKMCNNENSQSSVCQFVVCFALKIEVYYFSDSTWGGGGCLAWAGKALGVSCVCVQRGEMQETVMESLFAPTASSPNYYAFCPPRGRI